MNDAEKQNLMLQQYRLYAEQKDNFTNRSFLTNRFYLCTCIILLVLINLFKNVVFVYALSLPFIFSFVGMFICILWWMNMDSYNFLIKIKFSKVLEEIEKELPAALFSMEHNAIEELRKDKKGFLFSDIQKTFSIILFIVFFIALIDELIPVILQLFI